MLRMLSFFVIGRVIVAGARVVVPLLVFILPGHLLRFEARDDSGNRTCRGSGCGAKR